MNDDYDPNEYEASGWGLWGWYDDNEEESDDRS